MFLFVLSVTTRLWNPERAKSAAATPWGTVPVVKFGEGDWYRPCARAAPGRARMLTNVAAATGTVANRREKPSAKEREKVGT